ncbi:hypothetical protein C9J03_17335 [Photobacterium gaetbulicola]|uniref:FUSC family protein n=1 Tax=Photobacterium gaetbulicola Gung47 TaxID=658445 RepID=A0A0C5WTN6_9GAMM|nr:FUSC family protein [Photobacterium gaetbulicola]AJR06395.1 hypothetical protein H744_1c1372 [Photobacterium gaetbulicola Gung47]PSU05491.1 hypothetical protein C9J03_17335 [Photobacterium gaetbulicola]
MLNQRCILPLKVALALTLAIVSALWLGWERPYWAGFAVVVMAATETSGHSLKKGRHRLVGTLLGVLAAFLLVGLFAQQPLPFLACYSLFAALCVYLQGNPRNGYMWTICLMVCSLVVVMGKLLPEQTFSVAVLRLQETVLGIVCFTLVFSLLWPTSSHRTVIATLKLYFDNQSKQLQIAMAELNDHNTFTKALTLSDSLKQLTRLEDLIYAASADSYHIAHDYPKWQTLLSQLNRWALLCGHLAEASALTSEKMAPEQCAVIASLLERLSSRAQDALALLEGRAVIDGRSRLPQNVALLPSKPLDNEKAGSIDDHHGATMMLGSLLTKIDQLQYDLVATLSELTAQSHQGNAKYNQPHQAVSAPGSFTARWAFRPDSAVAALKACLVIWVCIALWLYVPMPGGAMIVLLGAIFSCVVLSLPFASVKALSFSMFGWSLFVLAQYVLLMPMLTEIWQLSAFYFINAFGIWYVFCRPQQALQRMLGTQLLIMMTSGAMQLTPVYDIQSALLQLMLIGIVMLIIFWVNHTVFSGTPESVFLRELGRLRTGLKLDLQQFTKPKHQQAGHSIVLKRQDPLRSVAMAETAISRINWQAYPELEPAKVGTVITGAYKACLLYRAFEDNYRHWQTASQHRAIEALIAKITQSLVAILEESTVNPTLTEHQYQLDRLLFELQRYLIGLDRESILQFSLSADDVDASYRLLISLQLLIDSFKTLIINVQHNHIHQLRLQPFAI